MLDANVVVTHCDPKSPVSEAYRVLRTNIQYSGVDKPMKTIVVTSSGPVEGKTTTIVNLAVTFAQAGCRVLLIDSDMRKPKLHKVFVIPNTKGLTNLLIEHGDYRDYVQDCDVPNLEILTCGTIPHNPSELLSSRTMRELLEKVKQDYDIVFLDAPPVGSVTDAAVISTFVDGMILVAYAGHVKIGSLRLTKELLEKVNANILGVVLNQLDRNVGSNYYYYHDYYYGEDGKTKGKRKSIKRGSRTSKPDTGAIKAGSLFQNEPEM